MKILWLAHRDPMNPKAGGAERTIYEVCMRLTKKGHKITLLTGGWKGCKAKDNLDGITIYRYGNSLCPHLALPIFLLKTKFDIVVNDLGHAVPWVLSAIMSDRNVVFFHHLLSYTKIFKISIGCAGFCYKGCVSVNNEIAFLNGHYDLS